MPDDDADDDPGTGTTSDPLDHAQEGLRDPSAHPEDEPRIGGGQQPGGPTASGVEDGDMAAGAPSGVDHPENAVPKRARPEPH